jgi:gluconokinase
MAPMGVAGCGKTAMGKSFAAWLGVRYFDGDDLHPPENAAKMNRGEPLDDADRWPWLSRIGREPAAAERPTIISCSALKRAYWTGRRRVGVAHHLMRSSRPGWRPTRAIFMHVALLANKFATFEPPGPDENAIAIAIDQPLDAVVDVIVAKLGACQNDQHGRADRRGSHGRRHRRAAG